MGVYGQLLDTPQLTLGDTRYDPPLSKATVLLYYLAYKGDWCSRDELLYVFYPDTAENTARSNLRQLLTSIRRLPYGQGLSVEAGRTAWPIATDVQAFRQAVRQGQWGQAVGLYQGELLRGVTLPNAPEFESWLELERQELLGEWREAVLALAGELEVSGRHLQAAELLERLFKADPLDEEGLRRLLQVLYLGGQQGKALETFKTFQGRLADELGGEPEGSTLELVKQIRQGEPLAQSTVNTGTASSSTAQAAVVAASAVRRQARHNLLAQATPFVGREDERGQLSQMLGDPTCRLLTLVGPGGIGKTRLVLEVAREQLEGFKDGVYFVNFVPVASPELMVYTIGDALDFAFFGQQAPQEQLLDYLRDKELLLVLDNLEHLLDGVALLSALLEHAPNVKLLATSRERLNLRGERVFDLLGLSVPDALQEAQDYDAVRLFTQTAGGVRPDFILDETTLPAIIRICQLVQGMPLAIELAASWLRTLTLEDIATEIEKGIFFLEASTRDMPARHRSIRAVFDYSWELLTQEEQAVLRKLAVFQGGFRREAAAEVAGASLPVLASLVDKSFLTLTPAGRYRRHPLVIQYTQEKLGEQPEERVQTRERHCQYYLQLVREQERAISLRGKEVLRAFEEDLANIRVAWAWLIENERLEDIKTYALVLYFIVWPRVPEGRTLFSQAVAGLDARNPAHRVALGYVLTLSWRSEQGVELLLASEDSVGIMLAKFWRGMHVWIQGDLLGARVLLRESLELSRAHPEIRCTGMVLNTLAMVEREFGSFRHVKKFFEEAIAEAERLGDSFYAGALKHEYGVYLARHASAEEGEKLVREGLEIVRHSSALAMEANVLANLAFVVFKRGRYDEAEAIALEALSLAESQRNVYFVAFALTRLARVALARGDYPKAQRQLQESLRNSWECQHLVFVLEALILFAELALLEGRPTQAAEWLGMVQKHPAYLNEHTLEVAWLLGYLRERPLEEELEEALGRGKSLVIDEVVAELLS